MPSLTPDSSSCQSQTAEWCEHPSFGELERQFAEDTQIPQLDMTSGTIPFLREFGSWQRTTTENVVEPMLLIPPDARSALVFHTAAEHMQTICRRSGRDITDAQLRETWEHYGCRPRTLHQSVVTLSTGERIIALIIAAELLSDIAARGVIVNHARSLFPERRPLLWNMLQHAGNKGVRVRVHSLGGDPSPRATAAPAPVPITTRPMAWSIRLRNLSVRFPEQSGLVCVPARRVRFECAQPELHLVSPTLISGDNGAGKSTLAKLLCGLLKPEGFLRVTTEESRDVAPRLVFTDTAQQLFSYNPAGHIDEVTRFDGELQKSARGILKEFKATIRDLSRQSTNSGFQWDDVNFSRGLAAARATLIAERIAGGAGLLLLDEPTSLFSSEEGQVFIPAVVKLAHQHGVAIAIISHDQSLDPAIFHSHLRLQAVDDECVTIHQEK